MAKTRRRPSLSRPTRRLTPAEAALDAHSREVHKDVVVAVELCSDCSRLMGDVVKERATREPAS